MSEEWFGVPPGGWVTKDDLQGPLRDRQLGISIRFIRQWRPPSPEAELAAARWWLEWARWQRALTAADRAWLRDLDISPL